MSGTLKTEKLEKEIARLRAEHVSYCACSYEELVELIETREREKQEALERELEAQKTRKKEEKEAEKLKAENRAETKKRGTEENTGKNGVWWDPEELLEKVFEKNKGDWRKDWVWRISNDKKFVNMHSARLNDRLISEEKEINFDWGRAAVNRGIDKLLIKLSGKKIKSVSCNGQWYLEVKDASEIDQSKLEEKKKYYWAAGLRPVDLLDIQSCDGYRIGDILQYDKRIYEIVGFTKKVPYKSLEPDEIRPVMLRDGECYQTSFEKLNAYGKKIN